MKTAYLGFMGDSCSYSFMAETNEDAVAEMLKRFPDVHWKLKAWTLGDMADKGGWEDITISHPLDIRYEHLMEKESPNTDTDYDENFEGSRR